MTIPASIAPGKYVLRHEIISLHSADNANGAQAYPQCLNIEVTSDGTDTPAGEPATSFYKAEDPGIHLSIYNGPLEYSMPGPALYSGAGSSPAKPATPVKASGSPSSSLPASTIVAAVPSSKAPYSNSTYSSTASPAPTSIYIAPTTTEAAETYPTSTQQDVAAPTVPAEVQPTSAPTPEAEIPSTPSTTAAVYEPAPSEATAPVATKSPFGYDSKPDKDLPEGFTLRDLQQWVAYLLKQGWSNSRTHARHFAV